MYEINVYNTIDEVKCDWDSVAAHSESAFHTSLWLKMHENASVARLYPYYIVVYDYKTPVAICPVYLTEYCPKFEMVRKHLLIDPKHQFQGKLLIGHTMYGGYSDIIIICDNKNVIYNLVLDMIHHIAVVENCDGYAFPMVHQSNESFLAILSERGFAKSYLNSVNKLDIKWTTMKDFYSSFPKQKKKGKMRRIIRCSERNGASILIGKESVPSKAIVELTTHTCSNHESPVFFNKDHIEYILKYLDSIIEVFGVLAEGKIIGSFICLKYNGILTPWAVGLDYTYLKKYDQYNYIYAKMIEYAIQNNLHKIEFGRATFYIKSKYGCHRSPVLLCIKTINNNKRENIENWTKELHISALKELKAFCDKTNKGQMYLDNVSIINNLTGRHYIY